MMWLFHLVLCLLLPPISNVVWSQTIYSQYPSRSNVLAFADGPPVDGTSNHTKRHPDLEVLAFVTPWNDAGYALAEAYRGRLSSVSPVWYSVKPTEDEMKRYAVLGGPSGKTDAEWYQRLSRPGVDESNGRALPPLKILPRFRFEDWKVEDYQKLLGSAIEGVALTENILMEVTIRGYDGIVLEAGAMWALGEPIKVLSERLHQEGKIIIIVTPPMRHEPYSEELDDMVSRAVKELSPVVDGIQVMTYDYTGPEGIPIDTKGRNFPPDSLLMRDGIRVPGPNTPLSHLKANMISLSGQTDSSSPSVDPLSQSGVFDDFGEPVYNETASGTLSKLIMGIPMYGYSYPLAHVHVSGNTQAVTPPSSPTAGKDNSTEEQEKYRLKADQRDLTTLKDSARILAARGTAVTIRDVREVLQTGKALVRRDESSGEAYFDYLKLKEDGSMHTREDGSKAPIAWYRRAFWPTYATMSERIEVVKEMGGNAIALWDIGQGGAWLLHAL